MKNEGELGMFFGYHNGTSHRCLYHHSFYYISVISTFVESLVNTREMKPGNSWDIGPQRSPAHVMEQHARFNPQLYAKYFPDETVYITSIREPVSWFISYVDFMAVFK